MEFDFKTALANTPLCYEPCDAVKFCYQAAYGAEHLLEDKIGARAYFDKEYENVISRDGILAEQISKRFFRVNLAVWKQKGLSSEWLFNMFYLSAKTSDKEDITHFIDVAKKLAAEGGFSFGEKSLTEYLCTYDGNAVHHSEVCRENASPAYRVIHKRYVRLIPLLERLACSRIMAVDGRAAAGKSTLAQELADITGAAVIHMDDFFLPAELRTEERLKEAGGNVHYERFAEEVLPFLDKGAFSYTRFDCAKMALSDKVYVKEADHYVVEGSYSHHPYFRDYADVRVFCDVSPEIQLERIRKRNGNELLKVFAEKWIPMEEAYFTKLNVKEKADIVTYL